MSEAGSQATQLRFIPPLEQQRDRGHHDDMNAVPEYWAGKASRSHRMIRWGIFGFYYETRVFLIIKPLLK
jgi:hypothetical protein